MNRLTLHPLAQLNRRIGISLESGIDIVRIWENEVNRASPGRRPAIEKVRQSVASGHSLAESLRAARGFFPPLMCEMVAAGEYSGRTGEVFLQLADHYDKLIQLRRSFLAGIWWPAFELAASIFIVGGLILALGVVSSIGGQEIDLFGLGLGTMGNFMLYVFTILFVALAIGVPTYGLFHNWFGAAPFRVAHRIPVIGPTIEALALSRMAWGLGMAINAGMDAIRSLRLSLEATQHPLYVDQVERVTDSIRTGDEMHTALAKTDVFPDEFIVALENGELTGQVTEAMDRLAADYRGKAERLFRTISVIGGVLVMMFVAAVIIGAIFFLFFRMIYPAYTMDPMSM